MTSNNQLPYLQPRFLSVIHNDFSYEMIAVKEYYEDTDGIGPTGNYIIFVLTPKGTEQFTLTSDGDLWHDDEEIDESFPDAFKIPEVFDNLPEGESSLSFVHPDLPEPVLQKIRDTLK